MKSPRFAGAFAAPALSILIPLTLPGTALSQQTSLGHGVPDDVHFYAHGLTSETPDPGWVQFDMALGSLVESRIHEDVFDLVTLDLSAEKRREARQIFDSVLAMFGRIDCGVLMEREVVFSYRLAMPVPEYLMIFRVPEDRIGDQVSGIKSMMTDLARMIGLPDSVREVEGRSGNMTILAVEGAPLELAMGSVDDALVLATSTRMAASSMQRLAAGDGAGSLLQAPGFRDSLQSLPTATEGTFYVDVRGLSGFYRQALGMASAQVSGGEAQVIGVLSALVEELDVVDHVLSTTTSDGTTVTSTSRIQMQPGFESTRLASVFGNQQPWSEWWRMVPADATGFGFDTGLDPVALYDLVMAILTENAPELSQLLEARAPFLPALRDNVLARISGEMAWVSFPQAGPDGCSLGESVEVLRLTSTEGISDGIRAGLEGLGAFLEQRGQKLEIVSSAGLHEIQLEAFPWFRPVLGVSGDGLVIATSRAAVDKIDRVRRGQEPDIRSAERFSRLGIESLPAEYLTYGQVERSLQGFNNLISGYGFVLSVLPEDTETRTLIKLGALLTKLARALRELEMDYEWASELLPSATPDVFVSRTIYRYR